MSFALGSSITRRASHCKKKDYNQPTQSVVYTLAMASSNNLSQTLDARAELGDLAGVASLLSLGSCSLAQASKALCEAAENGHAECVKILIPFSDPKARDSEALVSAARKGHAECILLLIPVSDPRDEDSQALCGAAENGHAECVKILIPLSDPKDKNSRALRWAACNGHAECVKLLIPVSDLTSSLSMAARFDQAECVSLLIPESDVHERAKALQEAIEHLNHDCAKLLIRADGALLDNKKALASVLSGSNADMLQLMLECEPLLLTGLNLSRHRDAAIAKGHVEMAALFSSIIEKEMLVNELPSPAPSSALASRRL